MITSQVYERLDNFSSSWVGFKAMEEWQLPENIRYVIVGRQYVQYSWGSRIYYDLIADGDKTAELNNIATLLDYQVLQSGGDYILSPIGSPSPTTGWYYDSVEDVTYISLGEIVAAVAITELHYSGLIETYLPRPTDPLISTRHVAREYFDIPSAAYCNWSVYTLGQGRNTLYTLICKDLSPQAPLTEDDYEIYVGVTSNVDFDGANVGTFAYTAQHFDISYEDLFFGMFEQEQTEATAQGYFYLTAALRHYDSDDVVVDDRYKFRIDTSNGYITSEETQTGGTIEFNYDTPAEEDDTFDVTADDLPGQAPGQNLSIDNLLTTSYVLTETELKAFGRYIWNNDLTTQMYAYQTSPIENILSCRRIPFAETGTPTTDIKLGNVSIPIAANICESLHRFQVGGVHNLPTNIFTDSNGKNHPWLAFSDFVQVSIYLPYVGIQKIPNTYCWGKTPNSATPSIYARDITIEYIYDVVFGTCAACLYCDGAMFAAYNGSCAIDIPITASNRAQIEHSLIKTGVNGAAASMNKVVEGLTSLNPLGALTGAVNTAFSTYAQMKADQITADLHFQTSGGFSSQVASLMSGDVYIFIQYPDYKEESTYKHEYGYPCNLSLNLSNLHGYTEIDHGVDLSSIPCFDDEKIYLEQALTSGFYL